eukprot:13853176-Ditylum_brightwellii.AAC.1
MFGHFENAECTRPTWLLPGVWERNQNVSVSWVLWRIPGHLQYVISCADVDTVTTLIWVLNMCVGPTQTPAETPECLLRLNIHYFASR